MLSDREIVEIVEQASTVWERLEADFAPLETDNRDHLISGRMSSWCEVVGNGDWNKLRQRLTWDGLDWSMARRAVGPVRLAKRAGMPRWVAILQEIRSDHPDGIPGVLTVETLPAFERILAPFALTAWDSLVTRFDGVPEQISMKACGELLRSLIHDLATLSDQTLHFESAVHRARERSSWGRLRDLSSEATEDALAQRFVESMITGGLATFLMRYPVLARLMATATSLWVDATAELLERLARDLPDIEQFLGAKGMLGCVTGLRSSLSDPHFGRRTVNLLTFASGHNLIYKPKDLGMEAAYNQVLGWTNSHGGVPPLGIIKVLERPGYGWVQFMAHHPCKTGEEIQRYYERAGMLLCLVYVLEGIDCHHENIIASGESPVLVDAEALCHPQLRHLREDEAADADVAANDLLSRSVLRTGLLPSWEVHGESGQIVFEKSGLGDRYYEKFSDEASRLEPSLAARMVSDRTPTKSPTGANRPTLAGTPARPTDHVEELLAGFRRMFGLLLEDREALSNEDGPLNRLANQRVRFLFRPTRIYKVILQHVLDPKYLRDGADWSIQLELLARAFISSDRPQSGAESEARPLLWPMLRAEREALQQGDIPYFSASTDSESLEIASGNRIDRCFRRASYHSVVDKLNSLDGDDLQEQSALIRDALDAYSTRHGSVRMRAEQPDTEAIFDEQGLSTAESLTAGAIRIAEQISERAIRGADRSATWITPQCLGPSDRYRLQAADHGLYAGKAGIALFLAAVYEVSGEDRCQELALEALRSLREQVRTSGEDLARRIGIGGCSGLGSIIYAMVRINGFLDVPLLEDARRAGSLITADRIEADRFLDITNGMAGAILGLLALHGASGDDEALERARWCGRELLNRSTRSEAGYRTWATSVGTLPTGMAHGSAGIGYALTRLFLVTGERCFLDGATEDVAYEAGVISTQAGNGLDVSSGERVASMTSWCHGVPGIGLSRLGYLIANNDRETRRELEVALEAAGRFGLTPMDHLCCGNMGRAEFLLVGGRQLSRPSLVSAATRIASSVLDRSDESGSFGLNPSRSNRLFSPGFFQGTAGIGYELLRMAHPLPSVLLWE